MSSNRLPGKILMNIAGRPLLGRVIDRVKGAKEVTKLIVATSINKEDDAIEDFCINERIDCFRGNLENVYKRFKEIVLKEKVENFIRISGDSPLIDSELIDLAVKFSYKEKYDLITNIFPRTFPKGQSIEIISSIPFIKLEDFKMTLEQKEHVTKYFYDNAEKFNLKNLKSSINLSDLNFCVDTPEDLKRIETIFLKEDFKQIKLAHFFNNTYEN